MPPRPKTVAARPRRPPPRLSARRRVCCSHPPRRLARGAASLMPTHTRVLLALNFWILSLSSLIHPSFSHSHSHSFSFSLFRCSSSSTPIPFERSVCAALEPRAERNLKYKYESTMLAKISFEELMSRKFELMNS